MRLEQRQRKTKTPNPKKLKGPRVPSSKQRSRGQSQKLAQHPGIGRRYLQVWLYQFGGSSEEGAGKEGRKDSWEGFVWFLSQVVGV